VRHGMPGLVDMHDGWAVRALYAPAEARRAALSRAKSSGA
jgi:hypothetical protein